MWPFNKKGVSIQPGESKDLFFDIPKDKEIGEIVLNYEDKYGNKYQTIALINFKERKIIRQDYKMTKKVKDCPEEERPKLVVDEKDLEYYLKE